MANSTPQYLQAAQKRAKQRRTGRAALVKAYTDWHWSAKPDKFIHVRDKCVPDLVGIGRLNEILTDKGALKFGKGGWLGFDPKHPHERIHIVLAAKDRERVRKAVKAAGQMHYLQDIAKAAGGTHTRYALPRIKAAPIGIVKNCVYTTLKVGEENGGLNAYEHAFGHEHSQGVKPILAADASGRLWMCGGSYTSPDPGVTG